MTNLQSQNHNHRAYYSNLAMNRTLDARAAINAHDYVTLNTLLASGLNPNIPAIDGRCLVHDAIIADASGTSLDILVHYHADVNARWASYLGWTPAHIAWFAGRADIVEKLRRLGADLSLKDSRGWAASHALPCPITRIEAKRKMGGGFATLVSHSHEMPAFA